MSEFDDKNGNQEESPYQNAIREEPAGADTDLFSPRLDPMTTEDANPSNPSDAEWGEAHQKELRIITRDFRSIRTYMLIAGICGPLSLIFGGVLVGTIGLIFGIIALRKISQYAKREDELGYQSKRIKKFVILAITICAICMIANIVYVVLFWPELSSAISSGAATPAPSGSGTGTGPTSTWG